MTGSGESQPIGLDAIIAHYENLGCIRVQFEFDVTHAINGVDHNAETRTRGAKETGAGVRFVSPLRYPGNTLLNDFCKRAGSFAVGKPVQGRVKLNGKIYAFDEIPLAKGYVVTVHLTTDDPEDVTLDIRKREGTKSEGTQQ